MRGINSRLFFHYRTDVDAVVDEISRKEPLITPSKTEQVRKLVTRKWSCSELGWIKSIATAVCKELTHSRNVLERFHLKCNGPYSVLKAFCSLHRVNTIHVHVYLICNYKTQRKIVKSHLVDCLIVSQCIIIHIYTFNL